jgi:hypothetical protein
MREHLRACFFSVLVCIHAPKGLDGTLVRLFRAGDGREGSPVEGSVAFFRGGRGRFDDRISVSRMVEGCLLLVEHISAQVLGSLVVVQLCLVCVAAVLSKTEFGLTPLGRSNRHEVSVVGGRAVGIKRDLCFVEALLVTVGPDLFAFGDALVEIDKRLLLIKFALLTSLRICAAGGHFRSPWTAG